MKIDSSIAAIVTGGASGLGLASVEALRAAGAQVAIFDLNTVTGEAAAAETGAIFCEVDVLSDDSLDAGFARARAANGQERILISCAGGGNAISTIRKDRESGAISIFPTAEFARVVALNTVGTFCNHHSLCCRCSHARTGRWRARGGGLHRLGRCPGRPDGAGGILCRQGRDRRHDAARRA